MATVIDALLVTLGLDTTDYKRNAKEAETVTDKLSQKHTHDFKEMQDNTKKLGEQFAGAKRELMALAAIALGAAGVKDFFAKMITGQAALGRTAYYLGMSARELDAWGASVEQVGGTAEGFQKSLQSIEGGFEAFRLGEQSPVVNAFRALGVNIADANGKMRPMNDLLFDLSEALHKLKPQDQIKIASMLGLDDGTLNLLRQGKNEVAATYDEMYKISKVTDNSIEKAQKAQKAWAQFKRELLAIGQTALPVVLSLVTAISRGLEHMFTWLEKTSRNLLGGTRLWDKIGELSARVLAYGGDEEAKAALAANDGGTIHPITVAKKPFGPRNLRNNNPGNIEYGAWAKAHGAVGSDGRFAIFPNMATGNAAMLALLRMKEGQGLNTISKLIGGSNGVKGWLGSGSDLKDASGYIADVVRKTGIGANQVLADNQMALVQAAMASHEGGYSLPMGAATNSRVVGNTSIQTNINGPIQIQTQATDANGIARDMHSALQQNTMMASAATGVQ